MAYETRNGKGRYYTRSRRSNGKVVREYYGCGWVGDLAAEEDRRAKERRAETRRSRRDLLARTRHAEQLFNTLSLSARLLGRAALVAAGYHQHCRGEWRLSMSQKTAPPGPPPATADVPIQELIRRANGGDRTAQGQVREFMKQHPEMYDGDLVRLTKKAWIEVCAGDNFLQRESLGTQFDALRSELAGSAPPTAVRLLADQAVLAWLRSHYYEIQLGIVQKTQPLRGPVEQLQKQHAQAQRQYVDTLGELEKVRALLARVVPKVASPAPVRRRKRRSAPARMAVTS